MRRASISMIPFLRTNTQRLRSAVFHRIEWREGSTYRRASRPERFGRPELDPSVASSQIPERWRLRSADPEMFPNRMELSLRSIAPRHALAKLVARTE